MMATSNKGKSPDLLNGERLILMDEAHALGEKAQAGTPLTAAEEARFDELTADDGLVAKATVAWQEAAEFAARCARNEQGIAEGEAWKGTYDAASVGGPMKHEPATGRGTSRTTEPEGFALMDANGKWHRAQAATTPIGPQRAENAPSAGELLAFWLTNDERHLHGKDPMASVTGHSGGAAGGFLVPSTISGEIIDKARAAMVTGRAGVRSMTLDSAEMSIIKVATDPTGGFYRELQAIEASKATFEQVTLRPNKYQILVPISREAIEDAVGLAGELERTAQAAIAQAVDQTVLSGTGANEPRGILNTSGVNKAPAVGVPTNYSQILGAVRKIYDANFSGDVSDLAWIHSPREWETYANLTASDGQPLQMPPKVTDLPSYATTAMPTNEGGGEDESSMIVGHFPSAVVAFRAGGGVTVEFLNAGSAIDADGTQLDATRNDLQWMRFTLRFDVATLRPDHFTILSGVTAA